MLFLLVVLVVFVLLSANANAACTQHYMVGNYPTTTVALFYACDTASERPGGGSIGDMAWATDTAALAVWSGSAWTAVGGGGGVPTSRLISTTAPLAGGGDLSADRTLTVATFGSGASGVVPASGGGSANFLRADGTWNAPAGGSTPTGTGFRHVTSGTEDAASSLVNLSADTTSTLPLAKVTDDGTSGLCLLSGGGGDPAWASCPGGGGGMSYAQAAAAVLAGL